MVTYGQISSTWGMRHLSDIKPGQVIGRYEFLAPIAQGGMAAVWAARQRGSRGFSKVVAIKTMLPAISEDPRFERMFLDEAQIASRIRHGNVVEILDLGEENEILYLVMEWVDGESLSVMRRRAADRGGIPQRLAVRIVADICAGLHAAHELADDEGQISGLVHRDVSPQNILVGYDGGVKILDFGVAKVAGRTSDTTSIGHARGKPPYMAPEQALGKVIDRRADIFSLGIIFYQLLVGRHPFRGENDIATLHNIISEQPVTRPRDVISSIEEPLEKIVLRALDRKPERRFQTAQEFELALEAILDGHLGRVRLQEIARFMSETMGATQEERRSAIRDAIRMADSAEPTQLDVSLGPPSVPSSSLNSGIEASKPTAASSAPMASDAGVLFERREPVANLDGRSGHRPKSARGLWQVVLAMAVGAVLAWLSAALISKPRMPERRLQAQSSAATTASVTPSFHYSEQEQLEQGPPQASATGDVKDARRLTTPRRNYGSGNRSDASGGKGHQNGLPPIPSPGF